MSRKSRADPAFYESGNKVFEHKSRLEVLEQELAEAYKRWEALETVKG